MLTQIKKSENKYKKTRQYNAIQNKTNIVYGKEGRGGDGMGWDGQDGVGGEAMRRYEIT